MGRINKLYEVVDDYVKEFEESLPRRKTEEGKEVMSKQMIEEGIIKLDSIVQELIQK